MRNLLLALPRALLCGALIATYWPCRAGELGLPASLETHFQSTYIWQRMPGFHAAYSGTNSLSPLPQKAYTFSATAFLATRPWAGGELFVDPEVIQGVPFSGLTGLGSPTNGEIQKVAGPTPQLYLPRLFARQTWALGSETEQVDSAVHQLAGERPVNRFVLNVGKMGVVDVFDQNAYSHDARTQFLSWASMAHGAYDYAADAQGYSWGYSGELYLGDWAVRAGRYIGPKHSNGQALNFAMARFHGDQVELEHRHELFGRAGAVRALLWRNRENMGRFDDAIALAVIDHSTPDVGPVRRPNTKRGWGLHVEQMLRPELAAFVRYSWNDGQTETYSFEEVERSAQAGVQFKPAAWGRPDDTLGILLVRNGLSKVHQSYLAAGGLGFFIGDGRLTYRAERISEVYYNIAVGKHAWIGADFQHISNPAYNADRGPVKVYGIRLHAEY